MTADKAIEYLDYILKEHPRIKSADFGSAIKLGIEALKFTKNLRDTNYITKLHLLPGEDSETASNRSLHHIKAVLKSPLGKEPS